MSARAQVVVALTWVATAHGSLAAQPSLPPLDRDPIELARWVERTGDGAVLAALAPETDAEAERAARGAAIDAAPFLLEPEAALLRLAELAGGRDPDHAPSAARAALAIARRLDAETVQRREVDVAGLAPARAALAALAADRSARADLRAAAAVAAAQLGAAGVPAP